MFVGNKRKLIHSVCTISLNTSLVRPVAIVTSPTAPPSSHGTTGAKASSPAVSRVAASSVAATSTTPSVISTSSISSASSPSVIPATAASSSKITSVATAPLLEPVDLAVIKVVEEGVHVPGNARDQGNELGISLTEIGGVLLEDNPGEPAVNLLEPEHGDEVGMRASHLIAVITSVELVSRNTGTSKMLSKMVVDPLEEDVVVLILGPLNVVILQKGRSRQLLIIGHIDGFLNTRPTACLGELPGQKGVREEG